MDRGDSEQAFGDMVNTHEEWTHEVFDAVPGPGRIARGALPAGVGGRCEPAPAVPAVQRAAEGSVQMAGAITKGWQGRPGRSFGSAGGVPGPGPPWGGSRRVCRAG